MTEQIALHERPHAETCPFCHDTVGADEEAWACDRCGTRLHAECFRDNRLACTVLGCTGRAAAPSVPSDSPASTQPLTDATLERIRRERQAARRVRQAEMRARREREEAEARASKARQRTTLPGGDERDLLSGGSGPRPGSATGAPREEGREQRPEPWFQHPIVIAPVLFAPFATYVILTLNDVPDYLRVYGTGAVVAFSLAWIALAIRHGNTRPRA